MFKIGQNCYRNSWNFGRNIREKAFSYLCIFEWFSCFWDDCEHVEDEMHTGQCLKCAQKKHLRNFMSLWLWIAEWLFMYMLMNWTFPKFNSVNFNTRPVLTRIEGVKVIKKTVTPALKKYLRRTLKVVSKTYTIEHWWKCSTVWLWQTKVTWNILNEYLFYIMFSESWKLTAAPYTLNDHYFNW